MISLKASVEDIFREAINSAVPELLSPPVAITASTKEAFGEYQCNSAMNIAGVIMTWSSICKILDSFSLRQLRIML